MHPAMLFPRSPIASPISVSTSESWDSDGAGEWSTFIIEVGTPAQPSRGIISTTSGETWVVLPEGCPQQYGTSCSDQRGQFEPQNSTTWDPIGLYELDLELNLGFNGNASYGRDTVALGYPGSGGAVLDGVIVAGIASPDFWLSHLGLDPAPTNFTTLNDPQPSFLEILSNKSMIPSISWGYTAGAPYRYNKVPGSLTLGGYDSSRFLSNEVSFPFYEDVARRLVVDLSSITATSLSGPVKEVPLMSEAIPVFIDSTIPYIYLPITACQQFEKAFGLQYNTTTELYTINNTAEDILINPNITFALSNDASQIVSITLPYAAFNLTATFPVVEDSINYFPLKRAVNESQYTLGRVFFQEAYVISDFERSTFSVSQCIWPPTFKTKLIAIWPISTDHHSSIGPIAGGTISGLIIIGLFLFFRIYKPRKKPKVEDATVFSDLIVGKPELDTAGNCVYEMQGEMFRGHEIAGNRIQNIHERKPELDTERNAIHEIHGQTFTDDQVAGNRIQETDRWSFVQGRRESLNLTSLGNNELEWKPLYEMPARELIGE